MTGIIMKLLSQTEMRTWRIMRRETTWWMTFQLPRVVSMRNALTVYADHALQTKITGRCGGSMKNNCPMTEIPF